MTPAPQTGISGGRAPAKGPDSAGIVIVNWNTGPALRACLRSIERTDRSVLAVSEVVVVDNASQDGSADALDLASVPVTTVRNSGNRGFGAACNQGAALCAGDFLLFLNPDTELYPDTLRAVGAFLRSDAADDVGICGGRILDAQGRPGISCSRFPTLPIMFGKMTGLDRLLPGVFHPHHLRPAETLASRPVDQVIGAFYLVRRSLFEELGGFDPRYFLYYEEVDLALRARLRGWRSYYLNEARVFHAGNASTDLIRGRRLCYSLCSRSLYVDRHWSRGRAGLLVALTLTVELPARMCRAALRGSRAELRETATGFAGYLRWMRRRRSRAGPAHHPTQEVNPMNLAAGITAATSPREEAPPIPPPRPPTAPSWAGRVRRALDVGSALVALVLLSPLLLTIALLVRVTSPGPVLFRQQRVGEGGRAFTLYKFRSMRRRAAGPEVTVEGDPRVTRVGRLLRSTSLDELPQLLNLVRGDMTLVGPRPETPGLARRYPPECRWVFAFRPGLTGPVQLRARELAAPPEGVGDPEAYYLTVLVPRRVALDAEFLADPSLASDLATVLRTIRQLIPPAR